MGHKLGFYFYAGVSERSDMKLTGQTKATCERVALCDAFPAWFKFGLGDVCVKPYIGMMKP